MKAKMQRCFSQICRASSGLNDLGSQLAIFMIMRHQGVQQKLALIGVAAWHVVALY